ncbi:MAG: class I SAM-dependent methyltransferase [Deltaproteobacteria bacterium]|nr:class I SAM-dependent methyltransferase [Deltaproteobacteria bacterium]
MPESQTPHPRTGPADIEAMFSDISGRYDSLNSLMSLGRDAFWRDGLSRRLWVPGKPGPDGSHGAKGSPGTPDSPGPPDAPGKFLDLATGTGEQILSIKKFRPMAKVTGLDFSEPMLWLASEKIQTATDSGLLTGPSPDLVLGDAVRPDLPAESFDSITISFGLRNIAEKKALYASVLRLLKPGGRFLVLEVVFEPRSLLAPLRRFHLKRVIPFVANQIYQIPGDAYAYLGDSVLKFPHPARLIDDLRRSGFVGLGYRHYTFGAAAIVWGHKPALIGQAPPAV